MGLEGGGGWESPRPLFETKEILRHPDQVFDSPRSEAERSSKRLLEHLRDRRNISYIGRSVEFCAERETGSRAPSIQIAWPITTDSSYLLELEPIQEGRGLERDILAYVGSYGTAKRDDDRQEWKMESGVSLERLFGVPSGLRVAVKPTIDRWAIGKDELALLFGENVYTLFMGLGFLFLGHQWMHIGLHEAGHLPDTHSENEAWSKANTLYASRHKKDKAKILAGEDKGLFELLQKPENLAPNPTIGKIMQYGLVSGYLGATNIPDSWKPRVSEIMREFRSVIERAHERYIQILA